ncbi:MAG: release factor glutamine methyltransferase [Mycoplasmataceae bacterium RV_VA103A]|nr:MAG: release factor glutamine methyltransferase [Mycoplasmataceae bacterium RV_VA103A]
MVKTYSYQDCWNYFSRLLLPPSTNLNEEQTKDLIRLCQITSAKFWLNFQSKILSSANYYQICRKIQQYQTKKVPVAYLNEETYFYNLSFKIEKGIFIPQGDTEILLEKAVELINQHWKKPKKLKILDIGTGCGNLAVCLAKIFPSSKTTATDISQKALQITKKNAILHHTTNLKIIQSNLFKNLKSKYNIIITNPPYISQKEYEKLPFSTKQQPKEALIAKNNGYWFYEKIIQQASSYLTKKFLLVMEIGYRQKAKILKMIIRNFPQAKVEIFSDLANNQRVIAVYQG